MKTKLYRQYILLIAILLLQMAVAFLDVPGLAKGIVAVAGIGMTVLVFYSWISLTRGIAERFNRLVNRVRPGAPRLSLRCVEELERSCEAVEGTITSAAEQILNIGKPVNGSAGVASDDVISRALVQIRGEIGRMKEEDERRNWISAGLAGFADILGKKTELKEYCYAIVSSLVKYLNANQGGFYLLQAGDDQERYLELIACYAYSKRKYQEARIPEGEGLLGQNMLERDFVFITDIPADYVKITSGLGEATPRNIVVAPLIANDVYYGAIELASFSVMKPHETEFIRKVCENIAAQISTLKNMNQTQSLLEESNIMARELQSREEEMRQNMEELVATQEAMEKKQSELSGVINAIDATLGTAEFSPEGRLSRHNGILTEFFRAKRDELEGVSYRLITGSEDIAWPKILRGEVRSGDFRSRTMTGEDLFLSVTFTPVPDANGLPVKVLCMVQDITHKKVREREFERLSLVANNTDNLVIITDAQGLIEYVNAGFTKMTGYESAEVIGKRPGTLLQGPLTDRATVEKLGRHIRDGKPVYDEILNYTKKGEAYWVSLMINPIRQDDGTISKFISVQAEITETKMRALDFHQKMQALSRSNAILETDRNGRILDINDNYLAILGYSREDVVGRTYGMLANTPSAFADLLSSVRESGVNSGEFTRFGRNGNPIAMKLMDYPVQNLHGEIEKIIEFAVDITREKRLQKEADRKRAELNSYLSGINNTIASAEFDINGHFITGNEIFLKVLGYSAADLSQQKYNCLMGEDATVALMWENLRLGKFFSGEFRMKGKSGHELWLNGTFNPVVIDGDEPEKIIMFAQFTTSEKEKLNELNSFVNAFKSTLPVLEFGPDFSCRTANEKAMKMFGVSRLALKSKTILDFMAPGYHASWRKHCDEIASSPVTTMVVPFVTSGHVNNYEVSFSVNRSLDGKVGKIIVILIREAADTVPYLAAV